MKKICVYTCITGDYDDLKELKNVEKGIDYYCFTNNKKITSKTWKVIYIEEDLSNVLLARKIKTLGHPKINNKYDIFLWMDAAVEFRKNIMDFINHYLTEEDEFVCFKHGERDSILKEMDACVRFKKENVENIEKLKEFYKNENYNYDNGLVESTVFIKRNTDLVQETMKLWFEIIKKYTKRDQLSFNYCIYKTELKVKWINEKVFDNEWFMWFNHNSKKKLSEYLIYYGDIDNDYNYEKQCINKYKINGEEYIINEKIKYDTPLIYIQLSDVPMIKYNVNYINIDNCYTYHINSLDYYDSHVFYNTLGAIVIYHDFKKGDRIKISLNFENLKDYEINDLVSKLVYKYVTYELENQNLTKELEKIKLNTK